MKHLRLNNGYEIPVIGLGTYEVLNGEATTAVKNAIDVGYRHFDCAWKYNNEDEVGIAIEHKIKEGVIKREDLFITTKLWNNFHAKDKVLPMLKSQLESLRLDYVDLYLIHCPFGFTEDSENWPVNAGPKSYSDVDYLETWGMMEEAVELGLARSIGVSNFNSVQLDRLVNTAKVKPVVNQIEIHPNFNQKKMIEFCKNRDVVAVGYCPLGRGSLTSPIFDPKLIEIGHKYKKTSAQVILNYLISLGICVIPKTVKKNRMVENIDVFDFVLEDEDVKYLDSLDANERICKISDFNDHKHFPFNIEF